MTNKNKIRNIIIQEVKKILEAINLNEGGLAGHMYHLYDNPELSFAEMKEIFKLAATGELEGIQEKLDGQNVFFSYSIPNGEVRFARNKGDIKTGGMDGADILDKWSNIPSVRDAFFNSYAVLSKGLNALNTDVLVKIFGPDTNVWYSAEIIYSGNPNVINYDRDALVLHEPGTETVYDEQGNPLEIDTSHYYEALRRVLDRVQNAVTKSSWSILGPIVLDMTHATQGEAAEEASSLLNVEIGKYGLSDKDKIRDYIAKKFSVLFLQDFDLSEEQKEKVGKVFASDLLPGQKKKQAVELTGNKQLNDLFLAKNQNQIKKQIIVPLEEIVHQFAVDVLDGVQSVLALHPDKEVRRLQKVVKNEIDKIRHSGDEKALELLRKQLQKLRSIDNITSSLEGILFKYKGNTYKLTGNFAPVNQLLGIMRFSR